MEKYAILLGYYDKQYSLIQKLYKQIIDVDLSIYESRYVFALKTQQFYTAIEDLLKQCAKSFENHIEDLSVFHKELLVRLHTSIPSIRPAILSEESFLLLDKVRAFRHFIRHAYDCELQEKELQKIQSSLSLTYPVLEKDLQIFREFTASLS